MIKSLTPSEGYLCIAEHVPTGGFRHHWCDDEEQAERLISRLDNAGKTVFMAQASFKTTDSRKGENALALKNFFMDIDCGEGKPFASQREGLSVLGHFCKTTLLPIPHIVNSGNGLYAHWVLQTALPASLWKGVALLLKQVVVAHAPGLDADGLVSDTARVLRPVGATHRKDLDNLKTVTLLREGATLRTSDFIRSVKAAYEALGKPLPAPSQKLNTDFHIEVEQRPSSALEIAVKCSQIAEIKASKGDVSEPLWYAAVGLLRYTTESPSIVHEWSSGHSGYSQEATDAKIEQHVKAGIGPTTCAKFSTENPEGCKGCRHATNVRTPLVLGYPQPVALERTDETPYGETPQGFTLSESGVFWDDGGTPRQLYPYPLYVSSVNSDHFGESITIRHRLPHEGWRELTLPSNRLTEPKSFYSALIDGHVQVVGKDNKGLFMAYVETFMAKLRNDQKLAKLSGQMGWHDTSFIHGAEIYHRDGTTQKVGYSASAPEFIKDIRPQGDYARWVDNTHILNRPGLEGLAFEFLCTAFGSPLVKFTGYEGAMLSVIGASGVGKTLTGRWGLSAWGNPLKLIMNEEDTRNALIGRFGVYGTLPAYIDEVSNIKPEELSSLAYRITQGRDKARMNRNAVEKSNLNLWNLLATVTSNHSLMDKLLSLKGDPGPEFNRIFEYEITEGYTKEEGLAIFEGQEMVFGGVGKEYAKYLVEHQDEHRDELRRYTDALVKACGAHPDERFWVMVGAVALYGGKIAAKIGVSNVDVAKLLPWVVETIKDMRKYKAAQGFDSTNFIGSVLDKYSNCTLRVASYKPNEQSYQSGYKEPNGKLVARIELDKNKLWVSSDVLRLEMHKMHLSPRKMAAELHSKGLISTSDRISLGRGTVYGGIAQVCWVFDLNNTALGLKTLSLVSEGKGETSYASK